MSSDNIKLSYGDAFAIASVVAIGGFLVAVAIWMFSSGSKVYPQPLIALVLFFTPASIYCISKSENYRSHIYTIAMCLFIVGSWPWVVGVLNPNVNLSKLMDGEARVTDITKPLPGADMNPFRDMYQILVANEIYMVPLLLLLAILSPILEMIYRYFSSDMGASGVKWERGNLDCYASKTPATPYESRTSGVKSRIIKAREFVETGGLLMNRPMQIMIALFCSWILLATVNRLYWVNSDGGVSGAISRGIYQKAGIDCDDAMIEFKQGKGNQSGPIIYRCGGGSYHLWPFYRTGESLELRRVIREYKS